MQVTGYQIQHAVREAEQAKALAEAQFKDGLWTFPGDDKPLPRQSMEAYRAAESRLARLQEASARYNLASQVEVNGVPMSLRRAISLLGGAGRTETMWREISAPAKPNRYSHEAEGAAPTRDLDKVVAVRTVTLADAGAEAKKASRYAAALRDAVNIGNSQARDIDVSEADFE